MFNSRSWSWLTITAVALTVTVRTAYATAVIALDPADGVVSGAPGVTVGWGFTITNGNYWVAIDSVVIENETSPVSGPSGGFTSYMDLLGGSTDGVTAPDQTWTLSFTPGSPGTGVGQYVIDPGTPPGAVDSGDFLIYYDEFSDDPNTCGSCYLDTLQMFDANGNAPAFTIDVVGSSTTTPEPAAGLFVAIGCAAIIGIRLLLRAGEEVIDDVDFRRFVGFSGTIKRNGSASGELRLR
jgi:hypothetical protein